MYRSASTVRKGFAGIMGSRLRSVKTRAVVGIAAIAVALSSCVTIKTRSADEFLIDYSRDKRYETCVPLILMWEEDGTIGRRQALVVPPDVGVLVGGRLHSAPPASSPWWPCKSEAYCWNMGDIVALVPARSVLTISRIQYSRGIDWWYGTHADLTPFAFLRLDDKPAEVEISDLSRWRPHEVRGKEYLVPAPDSDVLCNATLDDGAR
jgi:hypothetical protein